MSIGKKIALLRKERGLSQSQMAQDLHVSRQTISKWESDLSLPDIHTILLIVDLYDITFEELLGINHKEDNIEKLYESMMLVHKKLEKENKRRTILEIILICTCIFCIGITAYVYIHPNNKIIYQSEGSNNNDIWCETNVKVLSYQLSDQTMETQISCQLLEGYQNAELYCELEDTDGQVYTYPLTQIESSINYQYNGSIPLKDYRRTYVVLKYQDYLKVAFLQIDASLDDVLSGMVSVVVPYSQQDIVRYSLHYERLDETPIKGQLDATMHLMITSHNITYVDETFPFHETKEISLNQRFKNLEDITVQYDITFNDMTYYHTNIVRIARNAYIEQNSVLV